MKQVFKKHSKIVCLVILTLLTGCFSKKSPNFEKYDLDRRKVVKRSSEIPLWKSDTEVQLLSQNKLKLSFTVSTSVQSEQTISCDLLKASYSQRIRLYLENQLASGPDSLERSSFRWKPELVRAFGTVDNFEVLISEKELYWEKVLIGHHFKTFELVYGYRCYAKIEVNYSDYRGLILKFINNVQVNDSVDLDLSNKIKKKLNYLIQ